MKSSIHHFIQSKHQNIACCIQGVLKVKVEVKGHVIGTLL